jgi:RNA recognition motif-containing protein
MALTENGTPRIPNSRIFLGNLASERTSRRELYEIFSKYGRITEEIVLRRSFGFIQYDNPESAQAAINTENCRIIGGMRVDINLADNREPRKGQDLHQEDVDRGEQYPRERNVNRRDSPIRRKDIVNRRRRSRSRSPDRRPTKKRLLSPNTELYARIIFLNNNLKNYARKVEDMLSKNNIGSESIYLDRMTLPDAVDRAFTQKIRYVFVLGKQHESAGTVGLRINYRNTSKTEGLCLN